MTSTPREAKPPHRTPGRFCPAHYRYPAQCLARAPEVRAETLYVVGGLYGNLEALEAVLDLAGGESPRAALAFNGDFHWFDADPHEFATVDGEVLRHRALRGNVETEIADPHESAGCGCAYPDDVPDEEVERSNAILARLRAVAAAVPGARARLAALPMHLVAEVGGVRIGVVHGDAESLAGWRFSAASLATPEGERWAGAACRRARVRIFASSHTCLPVARRLRLAGGEEAAIFNNGAAGMPNFRGTAWGLLTRISVHPPAGLAVEYGTALGSVHVSAVRVEYDARRWLERFARLWPPGSEADRSYGRRLREGPDHTPADARGWPERAA